MKRLITLSSVLALVLAFNTTSFAQTTEPNAKSQEITASADVQATLSFDTDTDGDKLKFGEIPGNFSNAVSISPNEDGDGTIEADGTGTGWQQAHVTIEAGSGSSSQNLKISVTEPANLTYDDGSNTHQIPFTSDYVGTSDGTSGTVLGASDSDVSTAANATGDPQTYDVYLGGSLSPSSGSDYAAGTYEATIYVNVDYQ